MPTINKIFNGSIDMDSHPYRVLDKNYLDALNITKDSPGINSDSVVSNINGNTLVSFTFQSGTNKTIGSFQDRVRNRIFIFTWNSNGYHTISYFDGNTNSIAKVIQDKTDSGGIGILNFNPSYKIDNVDLIITDDGDLLFWTDGLNPPSKINVGKAVSNGYGVFKRSYLNVIKEIPILPPQVVYGNDNTVTVNNLRKKLFKFKSRFIFDDNEKSAWSAISVIPLPIKYNDISVDSDPTNNCKISIVIPTGESNVKKIEISATQSLGNVFSDFFSIQILDKAVLSIADNDIYKFDFYNDQAYSFVPLNESIQPFDSVPLAANAQSLPNGNVLCYSGIKEGYDYSSVSASTSSNSIKQETTQLPYLLVASQSGDSGFGTGNIHIKVIGRINIGNVYSVQTSNYTISFTATAATTSNVISGLSSVATTDGFTIVFSDAENLIISKSGEVLQRTLSTPIYLEPTDSFVWDYNSKYNAALIYFDAEGRTNSAITNAGMSASTPNYTETTGVQNIPKISLSISGRPPLWAKYFHILFTKNTTKSNLLYWVSDRTFKDDDVSTTRYAYVSIENLNTFIANNPNSPLGYSFLSGDRIRFIKCLSGTTNTIYVNNDYEIQASIMNPVINGQQHTGQFIKIFLPATSGTFDFGTSDFNNYFIEVYSPAQSVANGLDLYYEIGERYSIGNSGTANAFHQGMLQNQTSDLVTPATFEFTQGDDYYRIRKINTGVEYKYKIDQGYGLDSSSGSSTMGVDFISQSYNDPNITAGSSQLNNLIGFNYATNNDRYLLSVASGTHSFIAKGSISITYPSNLINPIGPPSNCEFYLIDSSGNKTQLVAPFNSMAAATHTFDFSVSFTLTAGQKIFMLQYTAPGLDHERYFTETFLTITKQRAYTVGVVDKNFSDYFLSSVNSYGRAWVEDKKAKQTFYPTLTRNGGEYQQNTTENNINRFYFDDQQTYNRDFGEVKKLFIEGQYMYVFQEFEVGVVPVLMQIIQDTSGNPLQANSNTLLNKIQYPYKGQYGIGNVPSSFSFGKWAKFFVDPTKGTVNRLSQDGIIPLSILYNTNSFFVSKLKAFNKNLNNGYTDGVNPYPGDPTVYGVYDYYTNKYIVCLEEINRYNASNQLIFHQDAYTFSFYDSRKGDEGFESQLSYHPENIVCLGNLLVSFKNGQMWRHDSDTYCNFYGVQYDCYIVCVFNQASIYKKTWKNITQMSSEAWECPEITTNVISYGSLTQYSELIPQDFTQFEGEYSSAILRDKNSIGGLINGDFMKGEYIIIKFLKKSATNFIYLNGVSMDFSESPLNIKT